MFRFLCFLLGFEGVLGVARVEQEGMGLKGLKAGPDQRGVLG